MKNEFSFLKWLKNIETNDGSTGFEALSVLSGFKGLENLNIIDDNNNQDQLNEVMFNHFKLRWHFKELLNQSGSGTYGNRDKFMYLIDLFYKKFNKYFVEYNKINQYNKIYKLKINSYKIKVLRKIKNLKKYFFYNNKRNKGLRVFSYLNSFSIQYHIKHILWHSPYSFLLFKKNNILNNIKVNNNFVFEYKFQKIYYNVIFYSYIFNILLNIFDIKEEWAYYLTDNNNFFINLNLLHLTFYYCYNYGNFFYFYLNELDIFRFFISLLKNYYNNFLMKLIRYRYIWEKKNYKINFLLKRYLKCWYKSIYFKVRYFIYQTHETYIRYVKRKYLRFLRKKYWIRNRVDLIPFWFIFDYYIKSFIKFLFNNYFIKSNYIYWWLNYRLKYSIFFIFWLYIKKIEYFNLMFLKKTSFWNFYKNIKLKILYFCKKNDNILKSHIWYLKLIINNFIFLLYFNYKIIFLQLLYKIIFFNYSYFIKITIIKIFNLIIDLKIFFF